MSDPRFAVVGATGAVGREMITVLMERGLPVDNLRLFASSRSAGEPIEIGENSITVEELGKDSFHEIDIALFSAGGSVSKEFAPLAAQQGAIVIDNSSAWRMEPGVPLSVPEVNSDELRAELRKLAPGRGMIIANPNCSTIQLAVVLKPILDAVGLRRVVVSTYQSVSGAGQKGLDELWSQTLAIFNQEELSIQKFPHPIAFNAIPHIDEFQDNGYTKEELKLINESRKILSKPDLRITATAVRVPVFYSHSESVNIETEHRISADDLRALLEHSPGVVVIDSPSDRAYPLALDVAGTDATYVGRIREDESVENGMNMWIVADNVRKGAALNAVQIAEIVINERFSESRVKKAKAPGALPIQ